MFQGETIRLSRLDEGFVELRFDRSNAADQVFRLSDKYASLGEQHRATKTMRDLADKGTRYYVEPSTISR